MFSCSALYFLFLGALLLFFSFCLGRSHLTGSLMTVLHLITAYWLWGLVNPLFVKPDMALQDEKNRLLPEDYPQLYALVYDAAKAIGCNRPISLFLNDYGIGICENDDGILVMMDAPEFNLLTDEELRNVMLHEFGHFRNNDTSRSHQFDRLAQKWVNPDDNVILFLCSICFLQYPLTKVQLAYQNYSLFTSRHREQKADDFVRENGNCQAYINATAKAVLYSIYNETPNREMSFEIYEKEEPCKDYIARDLACFSLYLEKNRTAWNMILHNELPAKVDSHPTLRTRMETFGIQEWDDSQRETSPCGKAERQRMAEFASKRMVEEVSEDYAALRKENYQDIVEKMQAFDRAQKEGTPLDESQLIDFATAFLLPDPEKARSILDEVLIRTPTSAYANFEMGQLLYYQYDPACVEHFYVAAKQNQNLAENAMDMIGEFALRTGRQQLLEEYRANLADILQHAQDWSKKNELSIHDDLRPNDLPDPLASEIVNALVKNGDQKITAVYSACRGSGCDAIYAYLLEFSKDAAPEERQKICLNQFSYLDKRSECWTYCFYDATEESQNRDGKKLCDKLRAVSGCPVWQQQDDTDFTQNAAEP